VTPLWDTVVVILGMVLLTPLTRKAHMTAALPAVLAALALFSAGRRFPQTRAVKILFAVGAVLLLGSTSLPLEHLVPGFTSNLTLFLALMVMALVLALVRLPPAAPDPRAPDQPPAG
jgi:hypothetical protein